MLSLRGKRAVVTGAGKRVGQAIAVALGAEGMHVAVHFRGSRDGAEQTCATIRASGGEAFPIEGDLSDRDAVRRLAAGAIERLGGLDVLVPSAANFERLDYDAIDDGAWDRALALNVTAAHVLAHASREALRASQGSIVIVTCTSATVPYRNYLPYVVSKGAVRQLMRVLAIELAPHVRVNAVAPGTVLPPEDLDAQTLERLAQRIPLGRFGHAEDVAEAVVYLARAPFVTGQEIFVDGGRSVSAMPKDGGDAPG